MKKHKWSADNIAFGSGGKLLLPNCVMVCTGLKKVLITCHILGNSVKMKHLIGFLLERLLECYKQSLNFVKTDP